MPAAHHNPTDREVTMSTFAANVSAGSAADALESVARRLPAGFATTGQVAVRSARHGLWTVEVENQGGDRNDCWVVLTSYGISPAKELGSRWESVLGSTAA